MLDYNDLAGVEQAFNQFGAEIAAVIVEPVAGNMNLIAPNPDFLPGLRTLCTKHGSVLIFDHLHRAKSRAPEPKADTREFVSQLGEPVLFGAGDMTPICYDAGFRHVRSLSFDEACLTLTGTYAREREFRFQRMVLCSVTPRDFVL